MEHVPFRAAPRTRNAQVATALAEVVPGRSVCACRLPDSRAALACRADAAPNSPRHAAALCFVMPMSASWIVLDWVLTPDLIGSLGPLRQVTQAPTAHARDSAGRTLDAMMADVGGNVMALVFAALVALPGTLQQPNNRGRNPSAQVHRRSLSRSLVDKLEQPWTSHAPRRYMLDVIGAGLAHRLAQLIISRAINISCVGPKSVDLGLPTLSTAHIERGARFAPSRPVSLKRFGLMMPNKTKDQYPPYRFTLLIATGLLGCSGSSDVSGASNAGASSVGGTSSGGAMHVGGSTSTSRGGSGAGGATGGDPCKSTGLNCPLGGGGSGGASVVGGATSSAGALGTGGTTGACIDPDASLPFPDKIALTTIGTNGSFSDHCDSSGNLVEYFCEATPCPIGPYPLDQPTGIAPNTSPFKVTSSVIWQEGAQWTRASYRRIEFSSVPAS